MARKRNFDRDIVLDRIMIYFWRNGYQNTGYRQLASETGVLSQSLYNAFGTKEQLYFMALNHYVDLTLEIVQGIIGANIPVDDKLFKLLILDWGDRPYPAGCLLINSLSEFENSNSEINLIANRLFDGLTAGFKSVLETNLHNIQPGLSITECADQLLTIHNGIQVAVRDSDYPAKIDNIALFSIRAIKGIQSK